MKDWSRALKYFYPDAPRIAAALGLMLGGTAVNALKPWPLAFIVDSILQHKSLPHWLRRADSWDRGAFLAALCAAILLLYIFHAALMAGQNYFSIQVSLRGLTRMRNELFAWLQRLSLRYHQGARAGDLIYRASWDTYSVQTLFQQGLILSLGALSSLAVMVIVMARMSISLTLFSLAVAPLLVLTVKSFGAKMRESTTLAQQADSRVTSLVQQGIAGLVLTQSCTREETETARFSAQTAEAQQRRLVQHGWELAYWLAIAVMFALALAGITWLGAAQVAARHLTVGELLVFLAYLVLLC